MATKVFISWSGDLSNKLAEAVRQWLPGVLQFVKPYFTPSDIEKGTRWGSDIMSELESSDIGIICLTKDNLNKPWILFESGALSKNFDKAHVCTLLFNVDTTDLKGPLTIFQNTRFDKKDFKKLVKTINDSGGDSKLEDTVLDGVFTMWWPKLEEQVSKIIKEHKTSEPDENRTERDILEEVLELTRLSTRHSRREVGFPPKVMMDLVESIGELSVALEHHDFDRARHMTERLDRPVRYLCERSPELYERYRMMMDRKRRFIEEDEAGEET